jgi:hypothetical protein
MQLVKLPWSDQVEKLLRPVVLTDESMAFLRDGVRNGRMELWHVNGKSLAVTDCSTCDGLFIRAYIGERLRDFAEVFHRIAKRNGIQRILFEAPESHTLKLIADYKPRLIGDDLYEVAIA